MDKESYMNRDNIRTKGKEWLSEVEDYIREGFSFQPESSALLVIDMQRFFLSSESHAFLPAARAMLSNVNGLIKAFRKGGQPIVFTRHAYRDGEDPGIMGQWWADNIMESDPVSELDPALELEEGDVVLRKTRYNAFFGTELDDILRKGHVEKVVITGVMTHLCCETTAREAFSRNYKVYFVVDGTATADEGFHLSSIRNLAHGFATPVLTSQVLEQFQENEP